MRQSLLTGNQRDLASLDLRDAPTNLGNLGLGDVRGDVVSKTFHNTVGELGTFRGGELLCLFEDLGYGLSHGIRIQAVPAFKESIEVALEQEEVLIISRQVDVV